MIMLCADDYALTEGISHAVGELAAAKRLSATSVMVTTPALAGDGTAPARAPRPPCGRAAFQSHARQPNWRRCRIWRRTASSAEAQCTHRACPGWAWSTATRSARRSSASSMRSRRAWAFRPITSTGTSTCTCCPGIRRPLLEVVCAPLLRLQAAAARSLGHLERHRRARASRASRPWRSPRSRCGSPPPHIARPADQPGILRVFRASTYTSPTPRSWSAH